MTVILYDHDLVMSAGYFVVNIQTTLSLFCDELYLKPEQEWVNPRDLAGMYVLIASFDINLAIRDLLTDRNTAAMITWTEVVFYSMWNFLKVNLKNNKKGHEIFQLHQFLITFYSSLVTQPMLQRRPNRTELRFQKCK